MIAVEHLPAAMLPATAGAPAKDESLEEALAALIRSWTEAQLAADGENLADLHERFLRLVEPSLLATVMQHSGGQCVSAARRLGLHRTTLRKRLDELGLGGDE